MTDVRNIPEYKALEQIAHGGEGLKTARIVLVLCALGAVIGIRLVWPDSPWLFALVFSLIFWAPLVASFQLKIPAARVLEIVNRQSPQNAKITVLDFDIDNGVLLDIVTPKGMRWKIRVHQSREKLARLDRKLQHDAQLFLDPDDDQPVALICEEILIWKFSQIEKLTEEC